MVEALNKERNSMSRSPDLKDLSRGFQVACSASPKDIFLILDAPDELEKPKEIMSLLQSFVQAGCKVCVMSRDIPEIRGPLSVAEQVEIRASTQDLFVYAQAQLQESDFGDAFSGAKNNDVIDTIVAKADGVLFLDQLLDLNTIRQIRRALTSIPTHIVDAFRSSVARIEAQPKDQKELAYRLIGWITHSHRRLKAVEIIHAFATEEDVDDIDEDNCPPLARLLKVCVGLVNQNVEDGTVGMVHTSAYEFFQGHLSRQAAPVQLDIAKTSLLYLSTREMTAGPCGTLEDMIERVTKLPFLPYAASFWGKHIGSAGAEQELKSLVMGILDDENLRESAFQALQYRHQIKNRGVADATFETTPRNEQALHLAAFWNLVSTAEDLLSRGENPSTPDSQRWTPLHWASSNGNLSVAKLLVSKGADLNATDSQGWTPLFWTAFNGDVTLMQFLLESGAWHLVRDISGWTALKYAASRRQRSAVEALLAHHKECQSRMEQRPEVLVGSLTLQEARVYASSTNQTAIEIAAEADDAGILDLLAESQVKEQGFENLWSLGHFDRTLHNIWRLLDKGEKINGESNYITGYSVPESDNWKSRLLHVAIKDEKLMIVQLLLELGADVNFSLGSQKPLHTAAFRRDPKFAELLLQHGADPSCRNRKGLTPLHISVLNGFVDTTAKLLEWNSDSNAKTSTGKRFQDDWLRSRGTYKRPRAETVERTPLMLACGFGRYGEAKGYLETSSQITDLLLSHGADVSLKDHEDKACLHYAIETGQPHIVRKVLEAGADVSVKGEEGMSALHYAAFECNREIVQMVIEAGAEGTSVDELGRNTFHHLSQGDSNRNEDQDVQAVVNMLAHHCQESSMNATWTAPERSIRVVDENFSHANEDAYTFTPLSLAIKERNWTLFKVLKARGALFETTYPLQLLLQPAIHDLEPEVVLFLLDRGATISPDKCRIGILYYFEDPSCVPQRLASILKCLPTLAVDINREVYGGETYLLSAASRVNSEEITNAFLDAGADPFRTNKDGYDAFMLATIAGNVKTLRRLLDYAGVHPKEGHWTSNIRRGNSTGEMQGCEEVFAALSQARLLEQDYGSYRRQPLLCHFAELGKKDLVLQLLHNGANVETSDAHGWTPLHKAAFEGHEEVFRILIQFGADVHAATAKWTDGYRKPSGLYAWDSWAGQALHLAAMSGKASLVEMLLARDVDVNASTGTEYKRFYSGHGPTALHIALNTQLFYDRIGDALDDERLRIAEMLVEHGAVVQGAADHLTVDDVLRFEKYPALWEELRKGITAEGTKLPKKIAW